MLSQKQPKKHYFCWFFVNAPDPTMTDPAVFFQKFDHDKNNS